MLRTVPNDERLKHFTRVHTIEAFDRRPRLLIRAIQSPRIRAGSEFIFPGLLSPQVSGASLEV